MAQKKFIETYTIPVPYAASLAAGTFIDIVLPYAGVQCAIQAESTEEIPGSLDIVQSADGTPRVHTVSITGATGTATVSDTAHGFVTGDFVYVTASPNAQFNGLHYITRTGADTYTFPSLETASGVSCTVIKANYPVDPATAYSALPLASFPGTVTVSPFPLTLAALGQSAFVAFVAPTQYLRLRAASSQAAADLSLRAFFISEVPAKSALGF